MQRLCRIEISHGSMSGAIEKNTDAKESERSRAVGAGIGSTVEFQQPTAVMQQEPSLLPSSSRTAPM